MLAAIGGILGNGVLGTIIGTAGSWLQKREARLQSVIDNERAKEKDKHEKDMAEISLKENALNREHEVNMVDKNIDLAKSEGAIKIDLAEVGSFTESQKTSHPWMEKVRAIMRPLLTTMLIVWAMVFSYQLHQMVGGLDVIPQKQLIVMYAALIGDLTALTSMSISWWFGSRRAKA